MDSIKQLIAQGRYNEALSELENLGENQVIDKLRMKSTILTGLGEYHQSYQVADQALKLSQEQNLPPKQLYSLLVKASACLNLDKTDEAKILLEQAQALIATLSEAEREQTKEEQAYFLSIVGILGHYSDTLQTLGDPQKALEQSIAYWKVLDQPAGLARTLSRLGNLIEKPTHIEAALAIWKKLGNKYEYARTSCLLGSLCRDKGNLKAAMDYNQEALKISQELDYKLGIAAALSCIGSNYEDHGDLAQALTIHNQILQIYEELDQTFGIRDALLNLGKNYLKQYELEKARHFFQRAYSETQKLILKSTYLIQPLFFLVQVALAFNNREEALSYQQQIQHIIDASKIASPETTHTFQIVKALILKSSKRLKDKMDAQKMFEALLQQETGIRPWHLYVVVVINLCELLLEELKLYGEPEVLAEIEALISQLQITAQDQFQYSTIVEILILRAKLELLNGQLQDAQNLLDKAHAITHDKGLTQLQRQIEQEQQQLEADFVTWTELVAKNAPMQERIQRSQLDQYIKDALKFSVKDN